MAEPKLCRMILIDPVARTITEHQVGAALNDLKPLIGAEDVDGFRIANHRDRYDYGFVDELGLIGHEPVHAFQFVGWPSPIAGKCLIQGASKMDGATCDAGFHLDRLERLVIWLGLIKPKVEWVREGNVTRSVITWEEVCP